MPTKTMNILKASLPFVPPQMQRGLSYYIKIEEFNEMVQNFQEDAKSSLSACSISASEERNFNINEYLAAISPYLTKSERDMIQMITNIVQAMKLYNMTKDLSWDISEPTQSESPPSPISPIVPIPPSEQPQGQGTPENSGFNIEALKNMLSPSQRAMFDTYSTMFNHQA